MQIFRRISDYTFNGDNRDDVDGVAALAREEVAAGDEKSKEKGGPTPLPLPCMEGSSYFWVLANIGIHILNGIYSPPYKGGAGGGSVID